MGGVGLEVDQRAREKGGPGGRAIGGSRYRGNQEAEQIGVTSPRALLEAGDSGENPLESATTTDGEPRADVS